MKIQLTPDNANDVVEIRKWCLDQALKHHDHILDGTDDAKLVVDLANVFEKWVMRDYEGSADDGSK